MEIVYSILALLRFSRDGSIDFKLVSRNCTLEGWSEPFPHYYDACGFDENDTMTGNGQAYYYLKLHCTRNFIHMNLFVSFILRAISVFIKDGILYAEQDSNHCLISTAPSLFFSSPPGTPTICVTVWAVLRLHFNDVGCWDINDNTALWWVIKGPVVASIMINFLLFVGIIIILVQKLQSPDIGGNESSIYL
ncbi:hypothetical protein Chor_008345 [Crotalus horridus]